MHQEKHCFWSPDRSVLPTTWPGPPVERSKTAGSIKPCHELKLCVLFGVQRNLDAFLLMRLPNLILARPAKKVGGGLGR